MFSLNDTDLFFLKFNIWDDIILTLSGGLFDFKIPFLYFMVIENLLFAPYAENLSLFQFLSSSMGLGDMIILELNTPVFLALLGPSSADPSLGYDLYLIFYKSNGRDCRLTG